MICRNQPQQNTRQRVVESIRIPVFVKFQYCTLKRVKVFVR